MSTFKDDAVAPISENELPDEVEVSVEESTETSGEIETPELLLDLDAEITTEASGTPIVGNSGLDLASGAEPSQAQVSSPGGYFRFLGEVDGEEGGFDGVSETGLQSLNSALLSSTALSDSNPIPAAFEGQGVLQVGGSAVPGFSVNLASSTIENTTPPAAPISHENLVLVGTANADTLSAGGGDDILYGNRGNDVLDGGAGADTLYGDLGGGYIFPVGSDVLNGGDGDDLLYGEQGNDQLSGGEGNDRLSGGYDQDVLRGDAGDDYLEGGFGNDVLYGGDGADILKGGFGVDRLYGGAGNDTLYAEFGVTILDGGDGDDRLYGADSVDNLIGGSGNDTLSGGGGNDIYIFSTDAIGDTDEIVDTGGFDTIQFDGVDPFTAISQVQQSGNDLVFQYDAGGSLTVSGFYAGNAVEKLVVGNDAYTINQDFTGSATFADFIASTDDQILDGTAGVDTITGGIGDDRIDGADGNDILAGAEGADIIFGGNGADTINGDAGNDILIGDVNGSSSLAGGDTINGGDGNDEIYGEAGRDTLHGDGGDDTLYGGFDNDVLHGDAGSDRLYGGFANDTLYGGDDADVLLGEFGSDNLDGGAGNDKLEGGYNNDVLTGGTGADQFYIFKFTGRDTVTDFNETEGDKINVQFLGVSDLSGASITDDGAGNTLVVFGAQEQMVLTGVSASTVSADDFIF